MRASTVSEVIGEQVARARHRRGWTQQHLAERIAEHGGHLDRGTVAKIESATRGVSLDEWLILAAALNVPPPLLLVPLGSEDAVALTPNSHVHPHLAVEWLCGEDALTSTDRKVIAPGEWRRGAEPLALYRQLRPIQAEKAQLEGAVRRAEAVGDAEQARHARQDYADVLEQLHGHVLKLREAGLAPPGMSPATIADMEAVGLDTSEVPRWQPPEHHWDAGVPPVLAKTEG